jgi:hypothetical protein
MMRTAFASQGDIFPSQSKDMEPISTSAIASKIRSTRAVARMKLVPSPLFFA